MRNKKSAAKLLRQTAKTCQCEEKMQKKCKKTKITSYSSYTSATSAASDICFLVCHLGY